MGRYDDIIGLPHHVSKTRKPMSMESRAAQFAAFAALNGHDEAIAETARLTSAKEELSNEEFEILSRRLSIAVENDAKVVITYFVADKMKQGGGYRQVVGRIKKIDELERMVVMADKQLIPLYDVIGIDGSVFDEF